MTQQTIHGIDFQDESINCSGHIACEPILRILGGLEVYQSFNLEDDEDQNHLVEFFKETYKGLLSDFVHLVTEHSQQTDELYDFIINNDNESIDFEICDFKHCKLAARHNRNRMKQDTSFTVPTQIHQHKIDTISEDHLVDDAINEDDVIDDTIDDTINDAETDEEDNWLTFEDDIDTIPEINKLSSVYDVSGGNDNEIIIEFQFILDLFDTIHCYFFHQYDVGYRVHKNEKAKYIKKIMDEKKDDEISYVDDVFKFVSQIIKSKTKLSDIARVGNKYLINDANLENKPTYRSTMMDILVSSDFRNNIGAVVEFIENEEYDSDAIFEEMLFTEISQSNIYSLLCNMTYFNQIKRRIRHYKLSNYSFSTGYIFYYWKYYKTEQDNIDDIWNTKDHGGYKPCELYIDTKYPDIKTEMLENAFCPLSTSQFYLCLRKANGYVDQRIVREAKPFVTSSLHYEIPRKASLKSSNLLSVVLYTDMDELQREFSKTFRKNALNEELSSIKSRHQEFANWGRILRETVEIWGLSGEGSVDENTGDRINKLTGPFYCGMRKMVMPEFNIRLCGPTSTSKQSEVSIRFGEEEGMIMQLNNIGDRNSNQLRAFRCQWLSNYTAEDEVLFIGGQYRIKLESIKMLDTSECYLEFTEALWMFDCMLNGTAFEVKKSPEITNSHRRIIVNLIKENVENEYKTKYPPYIRNTFECFILEKKQIVLNLPQIFTHLKKLSDLMLIKEQSALDSTENKYKLNKDMFKLFKNINNIIIYSTAHRGGDTFIFNIPSLVSVLKDSDHSNHLNITIKAKQKPKHSWIVNNWIKMFWKAKDKNIVDVSQYPYLSVTWYLFLRQTLNRFDQTEDCLTVLSNQNDFDQLCVNGNMNLVTVCDKNSKTLMKVLVDQTIYDKIEK
eukprot:151383_1